MRVEVFCYRLGKTQLTAADKKWMAKWLEKYASTSVKLADGNLVLTRESVFDFLVKLGGWPDENVFELVISESFRDHSPSRRVVPRARRGLYDFAYHSCNLLRKRPPRSLPLYHASFLSRGPLPACMAGAKFCELEHAANNTPFPDSHQHAAFGGELVGIWEHWGDRGLISKLIHPQDKLMEVLKKLCGTSRSTREKRARQFVLRSHSLMR